MKKRKLLVTLLILSLLLIAGAAGTVAYFTTEGRATNVITTGTVQLALDERMLVEAGGELTEQPYPDKILTGVLPGNRVSKIPYVINTGDEPFYARVRVDISILSADGRTPLPLAPVSTDLCDGWTEKNGWLYLEESLAPDERQAPFTVVCFDPAMGNEYQNCTVTVDVIAQAVQVKNNPIPAGGSVTDVPGWPEA